MDIALSSVDILILVDFQLLFKIDRQKSVRKKIFNKQKSLGSDLTLSLQLSSLKKQQGLYFWAISLNLFVLCDPHEIQFDFLCLLGFCDSLEMQRAMPRMLALSYDAAY